MKKTIVKVLISLMIMILFTGCFPTTKSTIVFKPERFQSKEDVVVYFYCDQIVYNSVSEKYDVYFDGKPVGSLIKDAYFAVHTTPRKHVITVKFDTDDYDKKGHRYHEKEIKINPKPNTVIAVKIVSTRVYTVDEKTAEEDLAEMKWDKQGK